MVFTKANNILLTEDEIIKIGEDKYLRFLWMVDGAFNSEKLQNDFIVNGRLLRDEDKKFTCKYLDKKSNECVGTNFEEEFKFLFASNLYYENVYSDGLMYSWHNYQNGKHTFTVIDNCNINRMGLEHELSISSIKENEIVYNVSFENEHTKNKINKTFVLVLEDNEWKISKAYYYDLCEMKYYIK